MAFPKPLNEIEILEIYPLSIDLISTPSLPSVLMSIPEWKPLDLNSPKFPLSLSGILTGGLASSTTTWELTMDKSYFQYLI